jgi:hypothetical protein
MNELPDVLYVKEEDNDFPSAGTRLVGSEYVENRIVPNRPTTFGVYKFVRMETYRKIEIREVKIEKID